MPSAHHMLEASLCKLNKRQHSLLLCHGEKSDPGSQVCNRQCQHRATAAAGLYWSPSCAPCPLWVDSAPFSRTPPQSPSYNTSAGSHVLAKLEKFRRFATSNVL